MSRDAAGTSARATPGRVQRFTEASAA